MVFLFLITAVLLAATVHIARLPERSTARVGELLLRWVLAGYCGAPMLVVAGAALLHPGYVAEVLGFTAGHPFQAFFAWAYLGMALIATLAIRWGGVYLIGPALVWAVFFGGATGIHLGQPHHVGTHGAALVILATHGLISVLLAGGLLASGVLKRRA